LRYQTQRQKKSKMQNAAAHAPTELRERNDALLIDLFRSPPSDGVATASTTCISLPSSIEGHYTGDGPATVRVSVLLLADPGRLALLGKDIGRISQALCQLAEEGGGSIRWGCRCAAGGAPSTCCVVRFGVLSCEAHATERGDGRAFVEKFPLVEFVVEAVVSFSGASPPCPLSLVIDAYYMPFSGMGAPAAAAIGSGVLSLLSGMAPALRLPGIPIGKSDAPLRLIPAMHASMTSHAGVLPSPGSIHRNVLACVLSNPTDDRKIEVVSWEFRLTHSRRRSNGVLSKVVDLSGIVSWQERHFAALPSCPAKMAPPALFSLEPRESASKVFVIDAPSFISARCDDGDGTSQIPSWTCPLDISIMTRSTEGDDMLGVPLRMSVDAEWAAPPCGVEDSPASVRPLDVSLTVLQDDEVAVVGHPVAVRVSVRVHDPSKTFGRRLEAWPDRHLGYASDTPHSQLGPGMLPLDSVVFLEMGEAGEIRNAGGIMRFLPIRVGTLDVPPLKIYDVTGGSWFRCDHQVKVIVC